MERKSALRNYKHVSRRCRQSAGKQVGGWSKDSEMVVGKQLDTHNLARNALLKAMGPEAKELNIFI